MWGHILPITTIVLSHIMSICQQSTAAPQKFFRSRALLPLEPMSMPLADQLYVDDMSSPSASSSASWELSNSNYDENNPSHNLLEAAILLGTAPAAAADRNILHKNNNLRFNGFDKNNLFLFHDLNDDENGNDNESRGTRNKEFEQEMPQLMGHNNYPYYNNNNGNGAMKITSSTRKLGKGLRNVFDEELGHYQPQWNNKMDNDNETPHKEIFMNGGNTGKRNQAMKHEIENDSLASASLPSSLSDTWKSNSLTKDASHDFSSNDLDTYVSAPALQGEDREGQDGQVNLPPMLTLIRNEKRSPRCLRRCLAQGLLHPAQCHSLC